MLWENNSGSNSLWESSASCEGLPRSISRLKVSQNHQMHQKIFRKKRKTRKETSGIAYPPLLLLLSVSISAELHLTVDAPWRLLSRLRRTYLCICKSHNIYRHGQYLEILILHWFNYSINLHCCSFCPRKINHCLPEIGCLSQINTNRGNILRLSKKIVVS